MSLLELYGRVVSDDARTKRVAEEWLTDGWCAVRVGKDVADHRATAPMNDDAGFRRLLLESPLGLTLTERRAWRISHVPPPPGRDCEDCDGEGFEECNLGHEHDCETCNGDGRIDEKGHPPARDGQVVLDGPGDLVVVLRGRYAAFLDVPGVIARQVDDQGPYNRQTCPVAFLDAAGTVFAYAMPMHPSMLQEPS